MFNQNICVNKVHLERFVASRNLFARTYRGCGALAKSTKSTLNKVNELISNETKDSLADKRACKKAKLYQEIEYTTRKVNKFPEDLMSFSL